MESSSPASVASGRSGLRLVLCLQGIGVCAASYTPKSLFLSSSRREMPSRAARVNAATKIELADGSIFVCVCKSREFRVTEAPLHAFCKCGQVYMAGDLPPLKES